MQTSLLDKIRKYIPLRGTRQPANWAACCYDKKWLKAKCFAWNNNYKKLN